MGDLFTRLTRFLDLSKTIAVTVPGLVAAAALAVFLQPVAARDEVEVQKAGTNCEFESTPLPGPSKFSLASYRETAIENQSVLENSRKRLQDCIILRTSELSALEPEIAELKQQIALLTKERDVVEKKYLQYVDSLGPLRRRYQSALAPLTNQLETKRKEILEYERTAKKRQLEVERFKTSLKTVDERLAEPGRLRPRVGIVDYFDGLTTKVVAFGLLAMVLGYTLDPLNRGLFGWLMDLPWVLSLLNTVRGGRFQVIR